MSCSPSPRCSPSWATFARRTFYRWRELGNAPPGIKLPNGEIRIWRSEFLAWLERLREAA